MSKKFFNKIEDILMMPFRKHFLFLISFFFLATGPFFLWQFFYQHLPINGFFLTVHCFIISYVVTLLVGLIKPDVVRKVVQYILMAISAISFAINFYCIFELGYLLDADLAMLMLGTDLNETREFASVMLPKWMIPTVLGIFLVFIALWRLSQRHNMNLGKKASWVAMAGLCLCIAINVRAWPVWEEGPIHRMYEMTQYEVTEDLTPYYTHPRITFIDDAQLPSDVVLIIGESFARCHSSLYGYDKETNPELKALRDSAMLFTFDSIDSPAPTTAESIRLMLSTYSQADDESPSGDKKWFEYTTIIELMQDCGYDSYWFGNQARGSKKNGATRVFAEACRQQKFLQHEGADRYNVTTDMVLVDSSLQYIRQAKPGERHFIIYHMMGSHFDYAMRYPQEFAHFSEKDYASQPQGHRATLASYDNSILYNDHVVSQIMNLYRDKDAVVIYVPDHGQVMYRNPQRPDYFSHGNKKSALSYALGVEIPLFIYASPMYQERHPAIMERIRSHASTPTTWNSDDLPYLIMDLIGARQVGQEDIQSQSLLK